MTTLSTAHCIWLAGINILIFVIVTISILYFAAGLFYLKGAYYFIRFSDV